jgi:hypothetical protein
MKYPGNSYEADNIIRVNIEIRVIKTRSMIFNYDIIQEDYRNIRPAIFDAVKFIGPDGELIE